MPKLRNFFCDATTRRYLTKKENSFTYIVPLVSSRIFHVFSDTKPKKRVYVAKSRRQRTNVPGMHFLVYICSHDMKRTFSLIVLSERNVKAFENHPKVIMKHLVLSKFKESRVLKKKREENQSLTFCRQFLTNLSKNMNNAFVLKRGGRLRMVVMCQI